MASRSPLVALSLVLSLGCASSSARPTSSTTPAPTPQRSADTAATGFAAKTAGMDRHDGFIPLYVDRKGEKLYLEIPRDSLRALYFLSLATGLGSNPIGLDRGAEQGEYVARFDRNGNRVMLVLENWKYRS
jgi:hypothetical protein